MLLDAGADPNALNANKQSPLHIAALVQHTGIVKALLANGARIDLRDTDGDTPLICAQNKKNADIVAMLSACNP